MPKSIIRQAESLINEYLRLSEKPIHNKDQLLQLKDKGAKILKSLTQNANQHRTSTGKTQNLIKQVEVISGKRADFKDQTVHTAEFESQTDITALHISTSEARTQTKITAFPYSNKVTAAAGFLAGVASTLIVMKPQEAAALALSTAQAVKSGIVATAAYLTPKVVAGATIAASAIANTTTNHIVPAMTSLATMTQTAIRTSVAAMSAYLSNITTSSNSTVSDSYNMATPFNATFIQNGTAMNGTSSVVDGMADFASSITTAQVVTGMGLGILAAHAINTLRR